MGAAPAFLFAMPRTRSKRAREETTGEPDEPDSGVEDGEWILHAFLQHKILTEGVASALSHLDKYGSKSLADTIRCAIAKDSDSKRFFVVYNKGNAVEVRPQVL